MEHVFVCSVEAKDMEPEDYQENGIWMCGRCHTPRQKVYSRPGLVLMPMVLCDCRRELRAMKDDEDAAKAKAKWEREAADRRMRRLDACFGTAAGKLAGCTFAADDGTDPELRKAAEDYVAGFADRLKVGRGLIFYGGVGRGKTFMAACIANALLDAGWNVRFTNFAKVANALLGSYDGKQDYMDALAKCDLLIIDDFGMERDTEYMKEVVYEVVNSRYLARRPVVITTNMGSKELGSPRGTDAERVLSRLWETCAAREAKGDDRRRKR